MCFSCRLACQQLGYSNGHTVRYATYAEEAPNPIFLDDVYCDDSALSQNEVNLGNCSNSGWGVHNCVHNEDIGATCCEYKCMQMYALEHLLYHFTLL